MVDLTRDEWDDMQEGWDANGSPVWEPYDVECARCGLILSCEDAYVEEGDEWECEACNIRCDAIDYHRITNLKSLDINFDVWDVNAEVARRAIERNLLKG